MNFEVVSRAKIEGNSPECECGSGLSITVNRIPIKDATGRIVWVGAWSPGFACLACDTRRLWRVREIS